MLSLRLLSRGVRQCVFLKNYSSRTTVPTSIKLTKEKDSADQAGSKNKLPKGKSNTLSSNIFAKIKFLDKDVIDIGSTKTQKATKKEKEVKNVPKAAQNDLEKFISNAKSVPELLSVIDTGKLQPQHALKVISKLTEWSNSNRAKASEFETNPKYLRICHILLPKDKTNQQALQGQLRPLFERGANDLEMVLNVAADDEAEKIIVALKLPQMVKVMVALSKKQRRSTSLLRTLAYNISSHQNQLNLKECGDVLFAMSTLSFHDIILLTRINSDIQVALKKNVKAAPVGSIITSLGHLKYRDIDLLDNLAKWTLDHKDLFQSKNSASLFVTLGTLNYPTAHIGMLKSELLPNINQQELSSRMWLDLIWSLSVLGIVESKHLESVLNKNFMQLLIEERGVDLTPAIKMKLLNINAYAKYLHRDYNGPTILATGGVYSIPFAYSKNKQILVDGLLAALKSLFTDQSYMRTMHDTNMGFLVDAECVLDRNRLPLDVQKEHKNGVRIAFMVSDFHDVCQGDTNPRMSGISALSCKLLEGQGYTVIAVPYNEFSVSDKLLKRVEYLDTKLRAAVDMKFREYP